MEILTAFPSSLISGDSLTVARTYGSVGVVPGAGWTVALTLVSLAGAKTEVGATETDGAFRFTLAAAVSATLTPGSMRLAVTATKAGDRLTVEQSVLTVAPDPTDAYAAQSTELAHVQRVITVCQDRLEGKVTADVQTYQLPDGVMVAKLTLREVRELLAQYKAKRARLLSGGRPRVREVWYALR